MFWHSTFRPRKINPDIFTSSQLYEFRGKVLSSKGNLQFLDEDLLKFDGFLPYIISIPSKKDQEKEKEEQDKEKRSILLIELSFLFVSCQTMIQEETMKSS